jgi:hypothetical protein
MSSFKTTGRLIGSTGTGANPLTDKTPQTYREPHTEQAAETKFVAQGENWSAMAANRLAGALATNIDNLAKILDGVCLRTDTLTYKKLTGKGYGAYGFPDLEFADPVDIVAAGYPEVNLGNGAGSFEPPAVWVYVGLDKKALTDGKVLRLYRNPDRSINDETGAANIDAAGYTNEIIPLFVRKHTADTDYHGTQVYFGTSESCPPQTIPPIDPIVTDLPPYEGVQRSQTIASWSSDGCIVDTNRWVDLHVRPGCFLHVSSSTHNDGIWCIREVADKKAVLTRGNLAQVLVDDETLFTAGDMVSWSEPPNHATVSRALDERENRAYVVFKDTVGAKARLWLAQYNTTLDSGGRVSSEAISGQDPLKMLRAGNFGESEYSSDTGLAAADRENWAMPPGTRLYSVNYASPGTSSALIEEVTPPGWAVNFKTDGVANGTAIPCSPPGFLLNPAIALHAITDPAPDALPDAYQMVLPGKYHIMCRTMTTVRERFMAMDTSIERNSHTPGALFPGKDDFNDRSLRAFLRHLRVGNQQIDDYEHVLNGIYAPTRKILGSSLYLVKATDGGGTGIGEQEFEAGDAAFDPGDRLTFTSTGGKGSTHCTIVTGWGDYILVRDVFRDWNSPWHKYDYGTYKSINVGDLNSDGGVTYQVTAVWYPKIRVSNKGASQTYIEAPPPGLNAEYWNHFASDEGLRALGTGVSGGNEILIRDSSPLKLITPQAAGKEALVVETDQDDVDALSAYHYTTSPSAPMWTIGLDDASTPANGRLRMGVVSGLMHWNTHDATNTGALWDWSSGTHLQLHPDGNRIVLAADGAATQKAALDITTDALGFEDVNTGVGSLTVYLSDTNNTSLPSYLGSTTHATRSIIGGIRAAILGDDDYCVTSPGVLQSAIVTNPSGLNLSVSTSYYLSRNRRYQKGADSIVFPASQTAGKYLYYDPITDDYDHAAAFDTTEDSKVWLAKVTSDATSITSIVDIRMFVHREDTHSDIIVGELHATNMYIKNAVHFKTLGAALAAIGIWSTGTPTVDRTWRIHIVGPTTEVDDATLGLTQPYPIPTEGVEIVGHSDPGGTTASVTWGGEKALLNINSKGLRCRDVNFKYDHNVAISRTADPSIAVFTNDNATGTWDAVIEGCTLTSIGSVNVEGFYTALSATQGTPLSIIIRDCRATMLASCGVLIDNGTAPESVVIENCHFSQNNVSDRNTAPSYLSGVLVDKANTITVSGNTILNAFAIGVVAHLWDHEGGLRVVGNTIKGSASAGIHVVPVGAAALGDGRGGIIGNNTVIDADVIGINCDSPEIAISTNCIQGGAGTGIHISNRGVLCYGNIIRDMGGSGINIEDHSAGNYLQDVEHVRVWGNVISDVCKADALGTNEAGILVLKVGSSSISHIRIADNLIDVDRAGATRANVYNAVNCIGPIAHISVKGNDIYGGFNIAMGTGVSPCDLTQNQFIDTGSSIEVSEDKAAVVGNIFHVSGAITVGDCDRVALQNNIFHDNTGLIVHSGSSVNTNWSILGNMGLTDISVRVSDSVVGMNIGATLGINTGGGHYNSIAHNATNVGPITVGSGYGNVIASNTTKIGTITATGGNNVIATNHTEGASILVDGDETLVSSNHLGIGGITFSAANARSVVTNNLLKGAGDLTMNVASDSVVSGNILKESKIDIAAGSDSNVIIGNSASASASPGSYPIFVGTSASTVVLGNAVKGDGILSASNDSVIMGNVINSTTFPCGITSTGNGVVLSGNTAVNSVAAINSIGVDNSISSNVGWGDVVLTGTSTKTTLVGNISVDVTLNGGHNTLVANHVTGGTITCSPTAGSIEHSNLVVANRYTALGAPGLYDEEAHQKTN